jgi:hypothetical protein
MGRIGGRKEMAPQHVGIPRNADENGGPSRDASPPDRVAIDDSCEGVSG